MKHIILPTDFSIRSLPPIHDVVRVHNNEVVKITLLHLVDTPVGIGDILFRLHRTCDRYPIPPAFLEACEVMANRYEDRIIGITPMIKYGATCAFLENLLTGLKADSVYMLSGYKEIAPFKDSIQMAPLLRRCKVNVKTTPSMFYSESPARPATVGDLLVVAS